LRRECLTEMAQGVATAWSVRQLEQNAVEGAHSNLLHWGAIVVSRRRRYINGVGDQGSGAAVANSQKWRIASF
jgi:hypothetical protein